MMKSTALKILFTASIFNNLSIAEENDAFKKNIDALSIIQTIPSRIIKKNIRTPIAVRYIKQGDSTPTCTLINPNDQTNTIELISPEKGSAFANCATNIQGPISFKTKEQYYAVYIFSIEDPRATFTKANQFLIIKNNGFFPCNNDEQLDGHIKNSRKNLKSTAIEAINKYGCKISN